MAEPMTDDADIFLKMTVAEQSVQRHAGGARIAAFLLRAGGGDAERLEARRPRQEDDGRGQAQADAGRQ
jgi:hypothetical protein